VIAALGPGGPRTLYPHLHPRSNFTPTGTPILCHGRFQAGTPPGVSFSYQGPEPSERDRDPRHPEPLTAVPMEHLLTTTGPRAASNEPQSAQQNTRPVPPPYIAPQSRLELWCRLPALPGPVWEPKTPGTVTLSLPSRLFPHRDPPLTHRRQLKPFAFQSPRSTRTVNPDPQIQVPHRPSSTSEGSLDATHRVGVVFPTTSYLTFSKNVTYMTTAATPGANATSGVPLFFLHPENFREPSTPLLSTLLSTFTATALSRAALCLGEALKQAIGGVVMLAYRRPSHAWRGALRAGVRQVELAGGLGPWNSTGGPG
jgi:hypothetical protein